MKNKQPLHKTILSVLAALFGIQSSNKAQADFEETNPWVFIALGIVFIALLISGLLAIVQLVLR